MTVLKMTLLVTSLPLMTILFTLNTGKFSNNDFTYNDITYNDITYNDITYNDITFNSPYF
jgi:hypothetical protein